MSDRTISSEPVSRRNFLGIAWGTSLIALMAQAGVALFQYFKPRVAAGSFGSLVNAGSVAEFPPGSVNHISSGRFYISHTDDGLIALWHRCTHLGCTVPWREDEGQFHCPCHSSLYNKMGEVIGGPAPRPLDYFPITIKDGNVMVDTSKSTERDRYEPSQATQV